MRALIQRVTAARVTVRNDLVSSIEKGLCVLVGIQKDDTEADIEYMVRKILRTKLFSTDEGRWKKSVVEEGLEILCVSQFTLFAVLKGNKPDFHNSMPGEASKEFYSKFLNAIRQSYENDKIKDGAFGEYMQVHIENDGPVTIMLDSQAR
ncbi:D-aminoacyl-tRNA deacylase [Galendromus occidentalis]|uniref:D-aminoacyl-tRNA deacylase n=1 Tax=Galendromus occidentalis TaxID=34638 RepID=A0AAJ6VVT5_9ACAR|nr:D-aminoacyl-tRNA deacylase [Galendromus occidentalis]